MKLLTKEILAKLPKIGSTDGQGDNAIAQVKFFDPCGGSTWFITEFDGNDEMFGFARLNNWNDDAELGYISLAEIESIKRPFGLKIERDMHWAPKPLSECKKELGI